MTDTWTFTWVAGPDTGGSTVLGCGQHIVGRAPGAAVRCDDGALEPHHVLIEISGGGATLRQLTGRVPVRVDGEAVIDSLTISGPARLEIGHSVLTACPGGLTAPGQATDRGNITATVTGSVVVRRSEGRADLGSRRGCGHPPSDPSVARAVAVCFRLSSPWPARA